MKWFRKTFLWASLGCLGASASAPAQSTVWQAAPVGAGATVVQASAVTLGRPTPRGGEYRASPATGLQNTSYVARGVSAMFDDTLKRDALPKHLPTLRDPKQAAPFQPVQTAEKPMVTEFLQNIAEHPEKVKAPRLTTPALPTNEPCVVIDDSSPTIGSRISSFFGGEFGGNRRLYAQGEFLLWTTRGMNVPPLATTASANDNPDTRAALGFGTTQLIFGDSNLLGGIRPGARFTLGYECDPCGLFAIEGTFFFLGRRSENASFDSSAFPVIGRPFFNINTGQQDRELTTTPEFTNGALNIQATSTLWGAEINKRVLLWNECCYKLTGLIGFRYLDLNESLNIQENTVFINDVPAAPGNPPVFSRGDRVFLFDQFSTRNRFYGGQVGANAEWLRGPWSLDLHFKLALGATCQTVDIDGGQRFNRVNGSVQTFQGGLYALSSNIGHHSQTRFAVVPEVGFKIGYNLTDNVRLFAGYDFLYWSNVVRPGDQIDTSLDANKIPNFGAAFPAATQVRPVVPFRTTSFWATGVNVGLEVRY